MTVASSSFIWLIDREKWLLSNWRRVFNWTSFLKRIDFGIITVLKFFYFQVIRAIINIVSASFQRIDSGTFFPFLWWEIVNSWDCTFKWKSFSFKKSGNVFLQFKIIFFNTSQNLLREKNRLLAIKLLSRR